MIEKRGPRLFPSPLCENLGDKTKDQTPPLNPHGSPNVLVQLYCVPVRVCSRIALCY